MLVRRFARRLVHEIIHDDIDDLAAMMTYYAIFAIFPMLLFILSLAMVVLPSRALDDGLAMASAALPHDVAGMLRSETLRMQQASGAGFAIFGGVFALWGASRGTSALTNALNRVYSKEETRPWWRRQLLAIGVTLVMSLAVVISLGLLVAGSIAGDWLEGRYELGVGVMAALHLARWLLAGALMTVIWSLLYKVLPDTEAPLRVFTPGAAVGVLLWVGISQAMAPFVEYIANYQATYGALAGVITFLFWLWLSNLALLVGAEISDVLADLHRDDDVAAAELATPTGHLHAPWPRRLLRLRWPARLRGKTDRGGRGTSHA
jgi:membrane protein